MALSREEAERLHRLQRQLDARSRLETEQALFRLLQSYDELAQEIAPIRQEAIDALASGDLDTAERLLGQVSGIVEDRLTAFAPRERAAIEEMIEKAALRGVKVPDLAPVLSAHPTATLDEILSSLEQLAAAGGSGGSFGVGVGYGQIAEAVKEQIQRKVYDDGLNLSQRLHTRLAENRAAFNRLISEGLEEGRGAIRTAKQIQRLDVTDSRLPKYLRQLESALKDTPEAGITDEIREAAREAAKRKGGRLGLRGPAQRVVQAAQSGSAQKLDAAIDEFLSRKAAYHAVVIARTEANAAFLAAHVQRAQEVPWVIGVAWRLSATHVREDVCDDLATQDLYDLGPGVYPPDKVPGLPHPSDKCYRTDAVDLDWFTDGRRIQIKGALR